MWLAAFCFCVLCGMHVVVFRQAGPDWSDLHLLLVFCLLLAEVYLTAAKLALQMAHIQFYLEHTGSLSVSAPAWFSSVSKGVSSICIYCTDEILQMTPAVKIARVCVQMVKKGPWVMITLLLTLWKCQAPYSLWLRNYSLVQIFFLHFITVVQQLRSISKIKPPLSTADLQKVVLVISWLRLHSRVFHVQGLSLVQNVEMTSVSFTILVLTHWLCLHVHVFLFLCKLVRYFNIFCYFLVNVFL